MAKEFNINTLFDIAFGIKNAVPFKPNLEGASNTEASRLSYLGTPVIFPITFKGKNYNTYNDAGEIITQAYEDFELPTATLANFRHPKIIRRTKIPGTKGTVKELYGSDDWYIDIRGICLADPSHAIAQSAIQQKEQLILFDRVFDAIEVVGDLFLLKGIRNIVIEDLSFTQLQGRPGMMPFTIRAKSDEPEELILP